MAGDTGADDIGPDPALAYLENLQGPTGLAITLVTHATGTRFTGRGVPAGLFAAMAAPGWFYIACSAGDDFGDIAVNQKGTSKKRAYTHGSVMSLNVIIDGCLDSSSTILKRGY